MAGTDTGAIIAVDVFIEQQSTTLKAKTPCGDLDETRVLLRRHATRRA